MLLHLCPQIFTDSDVEIIDLTIEQFGFTLRGRTNLAVRRPYPNKRYQVACRRGGRRAVEGIFIEAHDLPRSFDCLIRWAVEADRILLHHVRYTIIDNDFDALSENPVLWYGNGDWTNRYPDFLSGFAPVRIQPTMETGNTNGHRIAADNFDSFGRIGSRFQLLTVPTIERGRLLGRDYSHRMPAIEDAFHVR